MRPLCCVCKNREGVHWKRVGMIVKWVCASERCKFLFWEKEV